MSTAVLEPPGTGFRAQSLPTGDLTYAPKPWLTAAVVDAGCPVLTDVRVRRIVA